MTLAIRVIPCLDVDAGRVVKGVNFTELRDAGDPVELARAYDAAGADELTFLDITASSQDRSTTYEMIRRTAEQVFIPLTVGGGVRGAQDVDLLLRAGADKVGVNTAALANPALISAIADRFKAVRCWSSVRWTPGAARRGSRPTPATRSPPTAASGPPGSTRSSGAARAAELGAGEILLNSMDSDGTRGGFDLNLIRAVRGEVAVPVIAVLRRGRKARPTSPRRSRPGPTRCWPPRCSTLATWPSARSRRCWPRPAIRVRRESGSLIAPTPGEHLLNRFRPGDADAPSGSL